MPDEVREAQARYGFQGRIVVEQCPYCGETHYHRTSPYADNGRRLAECMRGEYVLVFIRPAQAPAQTQE